jgi:hypothetical protein
MNRRPYLMAVFLLLAFSSLAISAQAQGRHVSWGFSIGFGPRYYRPPVYGYYPAYNPYYYDYYSYSGYDPYYYRYHYRPYYPPPVVFRNHAPYRNRFYREHGYPNRHYGWGGYYAPRRYDRRR